MMVRAVLLAGGQGKRMRSSQPKAAYPLLGRPLAWYGLAAARQATGVDPVIVVGRGSEGLPEALGVAAEVAWQETPRGTGHALLQVEPLLRGRTDFVLVLPADMPLLTPATLGKVLQAQQAYRGPGTFLVGPAGLDPAAPPRQVPVDRVYCFEAAWLWGALPRLPIPEEGECDLAGLVELAAAGGLAFQTLTPIEMLEIMDVNTRVDLAEATAVLRGRINQAWMLEGVTLVDPASTYIELGVSIGQDTVIWPDTYLKGNTRIGRDCEIGPDTIIRDTQVGNGCTVLASVLEGAVLEDEVDVGPFARLRKGAHLGRGVHMGNFGEVKDSYLAPGVKMGHFSYVGDAVIGEGTNIGAGTITCNYDGQQKHKTEIGKDVFLGSDTMLVAPVRLGDGARTGAGAVVTHDVPKDTLVVGVPARPLRKLENGH